MNPLNRPRFRPKLESLEDRCLLSGGLTFSGSPPAMVGIGTTFSIQLTESPANLSQGPANPVILKLIDPLGLSHLVGQLQATPDVNGNVVFQNVSIDGVGSDLQIQASIANTDVSATSDPILVYAQATPTKDQINWFEGKYQTLERGLPYPLSVEWIARHIAQNYDASLFTHLITNTGVNSIYGSTPDQAYPHLVEIMKLVKELHPGFEIMGYTPAFTDESANQGYIPGGWSPPNGICSGFVNWSNAWANLKTDTGAPLVDTLFLDWLSPLVESEQVKADIYSYAKYLGKHIVSNAPIYTDNFQFAMDSTYLTAGDGVLVEGAMRVDGHDYDSNGSWIPGITINTELLWANTYKPKGMRLFFLTTEASGAPITATDAARTGESYVNRYGANGFTYTNSSLDNVDNTLNPLSNASLLNPTSPAAPTNLNATASNHQIALSWTAGANDAAYNIYRSTTSGFTPSSSNLLATASTTIYWDNSVTAGTTYCYLVKGVNSTGQTSAASNLATAILGAVTASPAEMIFTVKPDYQVQGLKLDANGNPSGSPFVVAPGSLKSISVAHDASGNLVLFGIDPYSNFVWDMQFDGSGNPKTSPATFTKIWGGGWVESIAVGHDGNNNLELFAVDPFLHHVWAMKFDNKNNPATSFTQVSKGGVATSLTVGHDGNGNPLLFTIDPYFSQIQEMKFNKTGDPITDFYRPANSFSARQISLGYNGLGNPELFAIEPTVGHVFYLNFDASGTATSSSFIQASPMGVALSTTVQQTANNNAELFSIGPDYKIYPLKFDNAGMPVGDFFRTPTTNISVTSIIGAKNSDGSIALFGLGLGDNQIYEETFDATGNLARPWFLIASPVNSFDCIELNRAP